MERYPCTRFQNMIRHVIKQTSKHKEDDRLKSSKSPAESMGETFHNALMLMLDRKSTRLNSSHLRTSRMPSSA